MEEEEEVGRMFLVDDSQKELDVAWTMVLRVLVEVEAEVDQVERPVEEVNLLTHLLLFIKEEGILFLWHVIYLLGVKIKPSVCRSMFNA